MTADGERVAQPALWSIFLIHAKLGLTSFGGGISGLMHAEFVRRRRWLTEREFLAGLAVAQALPGVNVANLAIWIGYLSRGAVGSAVALIGIVLPPAVLIVGVGALLLRVGASPLVGAMLAGVAAAAIGLSLGLGYRAARHAVTGLVPVLLLAATLVASALLHLSALTVIAVLAPLGIGWAWFKDRDATE